MSQSASIEIGFQTPRAIEETLSTLIRSGWEQNYHGGLTYLPLGDNDTYEWQTAAVDEWPRVHEILRRKIERGEVVGIGLSWRGTQIGGTFHFPSPQELMVILDADRSTLEECGPFTDMSWYLRRLLAPLLKAGATVEYVRCVDGD